MTRKDKCLWEPTEITLLLLALGTHMWFAAVGAAIALAYTVWVPEEEGASDERR